MEKKRVCAYLRVSTLLDSQTSSIQNQYDLIKSFVKDDEEFTDEDIFKDRVSGKSIDRGKKSDFNKLLNILGFEIVDESNEEFIDLHIRAYKKINCPYKKIYCKSTSRFSRAGASGQSLLLMLKERGIEVFFIDTMKSTFNMSNTELSLEALIDNDYSKRQSYNWKNYRVQQTKRNMILVANNIFGYDKVFINGVKYLKANETDKKAIRYVVDEMLKGEKGTQKIADDLNNMGYTFKGKEFNFENVLRICQNQHYCGMEKYYDYDSEYVKTFDIHSKNQSENYNFKWLKCEYIEPIMTLDEFNKMKEILNSRKFNHKGKNMPQNKYTRLLVCSKCNRHYERHGFTKQYQDYNYRCPNTQKRYKCVCDSFSFYQKHLEEKLSIQAKNFKLIQNSIYNDYISNLEYLRIYLLCYYNNFNLEYLSELNEQREEKKEQIKKITLQTLQSETAKEIYQEIISDLDNELKEIEKKLISREQLKTEIIIKLDSLDNLLDELKERQNSIKDNYTTDEYLQELNKIIVVSKKEEPHTKHKINNVVFLYELKIENEINNMFKNVLADEDIISFLPTKTIRELTRKTNPVSRYIVRRPTADELEQAEKALQEIEMQ